MSPSFRVTRLRAAVLLSLAACSLGLSAPALACGPDFPVTLLDRRAEVMQQLTDGAFEFAPLAQADGLVAVETQGGEDSHRAQVERAGLEPAQLERLDRMRAMSDADSALDAAGDLPTEIALYTAGAVAWHAGDLDRATALFRSVLDLPPEQRTQRGLWASYMDARVLSFSADAVAADAAFERTREWARNGAPDPLGLGVASFGEQAQMHLRQGDLPRALQWYREQAAHGSRIAVDSLHEIMREHFADAASLDRLLDSDIGRELAIRYLSSHSSSLPNAAAPPTAVDPDADADDVDASDDENHDERPDLAGVFDRLAARPPASGAGLDELAAIAYRGALYPQAAALAAETETPLAAWVRAKLALRDGDTDAAAKAYAQAAQGFPAEAAPAYASGGDAAHPACRVRGEAATLALSRGDFVQALELLYAAADDYWTDAAYVAERVVTVDELKTFVDRVAPAAVAPPGSGPEDEWVPTPVANQLRWLLARRLLREQRFDEALAYFDDADLRERAQRYAQAHREAEESDSVERARALFAAAKIARSDGLELLGYQGDPDYFEWDGNFDLNDPTTWDENYQPVYNPRSDVTVEGAFTSDAERARLATSRAQPLERFHYRLTATGLAAQAADALPPRSQAYAAVLCEATRWIIDSHSAQAQQLYLRYLREGAYVAWGASFGRQCPAPDFDKVERELHALFIAKMKRAALWSTPFLLVAIGVGAWLLRRRRRVA
jgi:hypothetical protein